LKSVKHAKRYAKMFINAVGMDAAPQALLELAAIDRLMAGSSDVRSLLLNPGFTQTEKESGIRKIAEKAKLSEKVVTFVIFLTNSRVAAALPDIVKTASAIYLEKMKQARATVFTPVEVTKTHEGRLKAALKKLIDRDVEMDYVIDTSLLGGFLVKVGSTMYDSSIKGQLRLLKDELIKG